MFETYINSMITQAGQLEKEASHYSYHIETVQSTLDWMRRQKSEDYERLFYTMQKELGNLKKQQKNLRRLSDVLVEIADCYDSVENHILSSMDSTETTMFKVETVPLRGLGDQLRTLGFDWS